MLESNEPISGVFKKPGKRYAPVLLSVESVAVWEKLRLVAFEFSVFSNKSAY